MTRALVAPFAPADLVQSAPTPRLPRAEFMAHLIATASRAPQTRRRSRAEPGDAAACYARRVPTAAPVQVLCRSV